MSEKWTPGPWKVMDGAVWAEKGEELGLVADCEVSVRKDFRSFARRANAQLIAAAPELYGVLSSLVWLLSISDGWTRAELEEIADKARAALAKARGEVSPQ